MVAFNDQVGPATQSITIPQAAAGIIVRFDCVGDGEVKLKVTGLGKGTFTCEAIADDQYSSGYLNTGGDRADRKGTKTKMKVVAADDVHWSVSVDLLSDKKTYDRLADADS